MNNTNDYMNKIIRQRDSNLGEYIFRWKDGRIIPIRLKQYELDIDNSWINYVTPTQKKYFKVAVNYAQKNKMNDVKVNRIEYHFDFDNMSVKMGTANDLATYKLKVKE